jgi:hypothetical protein
MSAIAAAASLPSKVPLVSKSVPEVPWTGQTEFTYRGAAQGFGSSVFHNCCWLEVASLLLLRDPFVRYFVEDFTDRRLVSGDWMRRPPAGLDKDKNQLALFKRGHTFMEYLSARVLNSRNATLTDGGFQSVLAPSLDRVRNELSGLQQGDQEGDPIERLDHVLPALRWVISLWWPGSHYQRVVLSYGCVPFAHIEERCTGLPAACPLEGHSTISREYEASSAFEAPNPVWFLAVSAKVNDLGWALCHSDRPAIGGQWRLNSLNRCTLGCDGVRYQRPRLQTLPWMLYVGLHQVAHFYRRSGGSARVSGVAADAKPYPVCYDASCMTIGPTFDNKYGKYRLVARVISAAGHFNVDIRKVTSTDFRKFDFQHVSRSELQQEKNVDSDGCFLLWERFE